MGTARDPLDAQTMAMNPSTEFADLYERHYAAVYHSALRVTGNPADAEDVLQTVFLRVLNQHLELPYAPERYFRRAAVNAALDVLRRRVSHQESPLDEADWVASKENTPFLKERLRCALASIDPADAAMFLLRYLEGMSNGELAEMFGQEKNNIAVRLHRIRQSLQAEME
jgi:RNA polymerase sigma-70 factor (ECF subfamily)